MKQRRPLNAVLADLRAELSAALADRFDFAGRRAELAKKIAGLALQRVKEGRRLGALRSRLARAMKDPAPTPPPTLAQAEALWVRSHQRGNDRWREDRAESERMRAAWAVAEDAREDRDEAAWPLRREVYATGNHWNALDRKIAGLKEEARDLDRLAKDLRAGRFCLEWRPAWPRLQIIFEDQQFDIIGSKKEARHEARPR